MSSGRVSSSCFTSGTRRVNLVTNPMIRHQFTPDCFPATINYMHFICAFRIYSLSVIDYMNKVYRGNLILVPKIYSSVYSL